MLGVSSGAALALAAANRGVPMVRLAVYEAPFVLDSSRPPVPAAIVGQTRAMVDAGRRGDAVKTFLRTAGTPAFMVAVMPPHENGQPLPEGTYAGVEVPTLVIDGGKSPEWMRHAQREIAAAVPGAQHRSLPGQTHMIKAKVLAPVLTEHFTSTARSR